MQNGGHPTSYVVKENRRKHAKPVPYDREKLEKSITAACLSSGAPVGNAATISRRVADGVEEWLEQRPEVTSADIRRIAGRLLRTYHPDASYLYEHHRTIV